MVCVQTLPMMGRSHVRSCWSLWKVSFRYRGRCLGGRRLPGAVQDALRREEDTCGRSKDGPRDAAYLACSRGAAAQGETDAEPQATRTQREPGRVLLMSESPRTSSLTAARPRADADSPDSIAEDKSIRIRSMSRRALILEAESVEHKRDHYPHNP